MGGENKALHTSRRKRKAGTCQGRKSSGKIQVCQQAQNLHRVNNNLFLWKGCCRRVRRGCKAWAALLDCSALLTAAAALLWALDGRNCSWLLLYRGGGLWELKKQRTFTALQ